MIELHHRVVIITSIAAMVTLACGAVAASTYMTYELRYQNNHAANSARSIAHTEAHHESQRDLAKATPPDVRIPPVENGMVPVVTSLSTKEPVVFLGIDDGQYKTGDELQMMRDNHIKASLFLSNLFIRDNPNFFRSFKDAGMPIENHTLSHDTNMVETMSYEQQKREICGMAEYEEQEYGQRPLLFRPPGGAYSDTMRKAAADCGMKAVVTWVAKANGGSMQYQFGDHLRPGDIVLMHFRPEFKQDMAAFIDATRRQGLHTELLENWLPN